MTLTRKEFLVKGFASLGQMLCGGTPLSNASAASAVEEYRVAGALLSVDQSQCLARLGGCFTCQESCPEEAIRLQLGVGIRIDVECCDGCGLCAEVCPLAPAVIRLLPDEANTTARRNL